MVELIFVVVAHNYSSDQFNSVCCSGCILTGRDKIWPETKKGKKTAAKATTNKQKKASLNKLDKL